MKAEGAGREELSRFVCFSLAQAGINPTVAVVRNITNLGSNDAIAKDIQKARNELGTVMQRRVLKTQVPEPLMVLVEDLLDKLWLGAMDQARTEFNAEREVVYQERDAAFQEVQITNSVRDGLLADKESLLSGIAQERLEKQTAIERVATLDSQLTEQAVALHGLQADIRHERAERTKERAQFSSDLQATRESHQRALNSAEGDRKYVMVQLDGARENERSLNERVKSLENDKFLMSQQSRQDINNLRDRLGVATLAKGQLQGELKGKEDEIVRQSNRIQELEALVVSEAADAADRARQAVTKAETALLDKHLADARNDPHIFEYCDLFDATLDAALNPDDGQIELWILNDQQVRMSDAFPSPGHLKDFCQAELTRVANS